MGMLMREFEFNCPFCGENFITYVPEDKLKQVMTRNTLITDIFNGYNHVYTEIFKTRQCSRCQQELFNNDENTEIEVFDVKCDAPNNEKEQLEHIITKMAEQCDRM